MFGLSFRKLQTKSVYRQERVQGIMSYTSTNAKKKREKSASVCTRNTQKHPVHTPSECLQPLNTHRRRESSKKPPKKRLPTWPSHQLPSLSTQALNHRNLPNLQKDKSSLEPRIQFLQFHHSLITHHIIRAKTPFTQRKLIPKEEAYPKPFKGSLWHGETNNKNKISIKFHLGMRFLYQRWHTTN